MYANKLCILSYNHTLCLKTLFWYKHKKTTLFCSDFVWRKFTGLKYFIAAKPNSKCYVNSMYFYSYAKGSAKRYLLNFVTFYNRLYRTTKKKVAKSHSELCSSAAAPGASSSCFDKWGLTTGSMRSRNINKMLSQVVISALFLCAPS